MDVEAGSSSLPAPTDWAVFTAREPQKNIVLRLIFLHEGCDCVIQLSATNQHYIGDTDSDRRHDCCVHGHVLFMIDDTVIEDGGEWCTSASALRFMRSVLSNHFSGSEEHMIPCCGHFMIPADDGKSVQISGCSNGIDFDLIHEENRIMIKTADGRSFSVNFSEYKTAVLSYAEQVEKFMRDAPARIFDDPFDKKGYQAFKTEWFSLKDRIAALDHPEYRTLEIVFSDCISISESDISGISASGISLKNGRFINFNECAHHYHKVNGGSGKCIGERDSASLSFTFYTAPLTTAVQFLKRNRIAEFFAKRSAYHCF